MSMLLIFSDVQYYICNLRDYLFPYVVRLFSVRLCMLLILTALRPAPVKYYGGFPPSTNCTPQFRTSGSLLSIQLYTTAHTTTHNSLNLGTCFAQVGSLLRTSRVLASHKSGTCFAQVGYLLRTSRVLASHNLGKRSRS